MRLFAGLPLPPHAVDRFAALRLRLASPRDGLRWSAPEQWRLTLRFFGEMDEKGARILAQELGAIPSPPLPIEMEALGVFPAKGILYAEVTHSPVLAELHAKMQAIAGASLTARDSHLFRPHITLARSRNRSGLDSLRRLSTPALPSLGVPIRWEASEMLLYRSDLQPGGAVYTALTRFPLQKEHRARTA